jgi:hypothetical protein
VPITRAERSRLSPRMGRSRDFRRPWFASIGLLVLLLGDVTGGRQQLIEHPQVGGRAVGGHFGR